MKQTSNKKMLGVLIVVCILTCILAIATFFWGMRTRLNKSESPQRSFPSQQQGHAKSSLTN